jgi:Tfp pilus assembly protein PilF
LRPRSDAVGGWPSTLDLALQVGRRGDQAHALVGLGLCALAADGTAKAADMFRRALEIFQQTGAAEATEVPAELQALTDTLPAPYPS